MRRGLSVLLVLMCCGLAYGTIRHGEMLLVSKPGLNEADLWMTPNSMIFCRVYHATGNPRLIRTVNFSDGVASFNYSDTIDAGYATGPMPERRLLVTTSEDSQIARAHFHLEINKDHPSSLSLFCTGQAGDVFFPPKGRTARPFFRHGFSAQS